MADQPSFRIQAIALSSVPTPPTGKIFVFVDIADSHLKFKVDTGAVFDATTTSTFTADVGGMTTGQMVTLAGGLGIQTTRSGDTVTFDVTGLNAADVVFTPSGNIAAIDVDGAIVELDAEKVGFVTLASIVNGNGASLVGVEDSGGNFTGTNAEVVLAELATGSADDGDAIHDNVASEISAITEKVTPVDADLLIIEDSAAANAKKRVRIGNLPVVVFGTEFAEAASEGVTLTTSTVFIEKLKLTTGTIPAGDYIINYQYVWNLDNNGNDFLGRVQIDDTDTIMSHQQEPKDPNNNQLLHLGGFAIRTLTAGIHTIDIDFATVLGGDEGRIEAARISMWRVA